MVNFAGDISCEEDLINKDKVVLTLWGENMLHSYCLSDRGLIRKKNEDNFLNGLRSGDLVTFAVADGMGGHRGGDYASHLAVLGLEEAILKREKLLEKEYIESNVSDLFKEFFREANQKIIAAKKEDPYFIEMGTTLTAAFIYDSKIVIAHVGDSRAYLIKEEEIFQITSDHSLVNELLRNGELDIYEAKNHPQKNVLTNAMGLDFNIKVDVYYEKLGFGTVLLLCTDGLNSHLYEEEILSIIKRSPTLERASKKLIEKSREAGGFDNITVCLASESEISDIF